MQYHTIPSQSDQPEALKHWFDSPLGRLLLDVESKLLEEILPSLFGYHLLQLSVDGRQVMFGASPIPHKIMLNDRLELGMSKRSIIADNDELPVLNSSIDVVLLHHALDYADNPHQVLREAYRVLRPGGHIVIVGFNPASLWGVYRRLRRARQAPWNGRFIRHGRLQDWLRLLELTETQCLSGCYVPPFESPIWRRRLSWLRFFARRAPAKSGAVLVTVARKDIVGVTPLREMWKRKLVKPLGVIDANPSANKM